MPDQDVVFVVDGKKISRAEYRDRLTRAIALLRRHGIGPGDKIGIALRNRPQFFELLAASGALGAQAVTISWRLKQEEIRYLVEDSQAKLIVYEEESADQVANLANSISLDDYEDLLPELEPAKDVELADGNWMVSMYSSGTTGRPKAIEIDEPPPPSAMKGGGLSGFLGAFGVENPGEVHMMCGPLYHSQPTGFSRAALASGHTVVMMSGGFDAETCLATIEREKVSWMTCVPTHFIRMLALPEDVRKGYDLSSIKGILHSAAPCPRDVKYAAMELFPPDTIWEVYGGTEGAISMISPQEWLKKPGSVGKSLIPGGGIRIMDEDGNHLPPGVPGLIYAPSMFKWHYRKAQELNDETWREGLFTLGDIGYLDEDGYLFITDRKKDMIISGGSNIYPAEVEAELFNHPAVADAAVIGVPDEEFGESVKAIIERRGEATEQEIIAFCRDRLAHYKCPKSIDFVDRLPRDPSGKLRKRELREPYWAETGKAV